MKYLNRVALCCLVLLVASPTLLRAATVYNFETDSGRTPFTDTVNGLAATFSGSPNLGGFGVSAFNLFSTLTGNVLLDGGPTGFHDLTLVIVFSAVQTSISMNFAPLDLPSATFHLTAFNGASAVGNASATGAIPPGFTVAEGLLSFEGAAFDRVEISSDAFAFAVDNVTVPAVPEPGTLSLLLFVALTAPALTRLQRPSP